MKVGDLVRYKSTLDGCGFGIILSIEDGLFDLYWWDDYPDYICDDPRVFELISASHLKIKVE